MLFRIRTNKSIRDKQRLARSSEIGSITSSQPKSLDPDVVVVAIVEAGSAKTENL